MVLVLLLLLVAGLRVARVRGRSGQAILASACLVALSAVLAHSTADYPLRTTALMATFAALAGLLFAGLRDLQPFHLREAGEVANDVRLRH